MKAGFVLLALLLTGCGSTARFVRSAPVSSPANRPENVRVFYSKADVNFEFQEIGRIFLKTTELTSYNPARDIEKIKEEAARQGADAVIVQEKKRFEASAGVFGNVGAAQSQDVTEYFGIAIVKK